MLYTVELITIPARNGNPETIIPKIAFEEPLARALFGQAHGLTDSDVPQSVLAALDAMVAAPIFKNEPGHQYEVTINAGAITFNSRGPAINGVRPLEWKSTTNTVIAAHIIEYYRAVLPDFIPRMTTMCLRACRAQNIRLDNLDYRPNKYMDLAIQLGMEVNAEAMSDLDFLPAFGADISLATVVLLQNTRTIKLVRDGVWNVLKAVPITPGRSFNEDPSVLRCQGIRTVPFPFKATNGVRIRVATRAQLTAREGAVDEMTSFLDDAMNFTPAIRRPPAVASITGTQRASSRHEPTMDNLTGTSSRAPSRAAVAKADMSG